MTWRIDRDRLELRDERAGLVVSLAELRDTRALWAAVAEAAERVADLSAFVKALVAIYPASEVCSRVNRLSLPDLKVLVGLAGKRPERRNRQASAELLRFVEHRPTCQWWNGLSCSCGRGGGAVSSKGQLDAK